MFHYGFRDKTFKLLTSYLSERHIRIKINGKVSSSHLLDHGESQGSILGPLLFYFILIIFLRCLNLKLLFLLTVPIYIYLTLKPDSHEPQLPVEKSVTLVSSIVVERRRCALQVSNVARQQENKQT